MHPYTMCLDISQADPKGTEIPYHLWQKRTQVGECWFHASSRMALGGGCYDQPTSLHASPPKKYGFIQQIVGRPYVMGLNWMLRMNIRRIVASILSVSNSSIIFFGLSIRQHSQVFLLSNLGLKFIGSWWIVIPWCSKDFNFKSSRWCPAFWRCWIWSSERITAAHDGKLGGKAHLERYKILDEFR